MKEELYVHAFCTAYLKPTKDRRYFECDEDGWELLGDDMGLSSEIKECDEPEITKTYYNKTDKPFCGVVVGYKNVSLTSRLMVETGCFPNGQEYPHIRKEPIETVRCAIVFYANNRKRLVPVENVQPITSKLYCSLADETAEQIVAAYLKKNGGSVLALLA